MTALLGIDVGTTGVRCLAIDERGRLVASASDDYPLLSPRPGWSEQRPEDWWAATCRVIVEVSTAAGSDIKGIGLAGQMHGAVFLDGSDAVIRPAILWNDQRTQAQCDYMTQRVGARRLAEITGNPALTGFQAPKILWLRDEEPQAYRHVVSVLLPKDYIRLRLTGERATDASDASGTLLLDLKRREWSDEILLALDIPKEWLPRVFEGPDQTGMIQRDVAKQLGLPDGLAVAAGGGDNAAAAVGNGIIRDGLASCSIGTSGVLFAHSDAAATDPSGRLHAFCHAVPKRYHLMGVTLAAGGSLRWWRDLLGKGGYDDLTTLAAQTPPGAEGLLFLPYLTGERSPHLDPLARGAFLGLTARHGLGHLTRAVMEGVAFSLRDSLEIMAALGAAPTEIRATGGGARSAFWRQILADVLGRPIARTTADEGPAYGAALLAGVAAGVFESVEEACAGITVRPEVEEPDAERARLYDEYYAMYRDAYPATVATMHNLGKKN
ncbi:MAG TPA: xylulokinase [Candidatus Sulfotelmatobacter sp.]|nr:xylulokinase [Candidatus Sulfotelmatobacter sp.]